MTYKGTLFKNYRMSAILLWPLFFLFHANSQAKEPPIFQLNGYMGVQGGESFHYRLALKDSIGNLMTGYSYTYKDEEQKSVKAYVTATLDRQNKTLLIKEQNIIYNHGFVSKATICLVNAQLSWHPKENNLSGKLITQTSNNGAACSSGSLTFIQKEQIESLFSNHDIEIEKKPMLANNDNLFKPKTDPNQKLHTYFAKKKRQEAEQEKMSAKTDSSQNKAPATIPVSDKSNIQTITEGNSGTYLWHSDKIIFQIWDGGDIDGDQVTITYNGNVVLKNYRLTAQKKQIEFEVGGNGLNIIAITANNEGANPPNTANIIIKDVDKDYAILAYNKTGKSAMIQIKKSK